MCACLVQPTRLMMTCPWRAGQDGGSLPAMRLEAKFAELRAKGEKALVLFITAGDPSLQELPAIISALIEGGADIIEIGIPFSDPIADGPTIQASSQRALDMGVTPKLVFEALGRALTTVPIVLMGYANTMLRPGYENFIAQAQTAGVSGMIACDMTADEAGDWIAAARKMNFDTIFLAAPTSPAARLEGVVSSSTGFIYAVSRTGVTGAESEAPPEASRLVSALKAKTGLPVCVGFGLSRPEQVRLICQVADGAVIGSSLVTRLANDWNQGVGRAELVAWIKTLKDATR